MSHRNRLKPTRISITVDLALANFVIVAASAAGETMSDVVRESAEYYMGLDIEDTRQRLRAWTPQSPITPDSLSWSRTIPLNPPTSQNHSPDVHEDEPARTRISFAVTPEMHQRLLDRAQLEGRSLASTCRQAIKRYIRDKLSTELVTSTQTFPVLQ